LKLICPTLRGKITAVLLDLEAHNCQPLIDAGVWRSPREQLAKYRAGLSKVKWSFHNANNADGSPGSLAADIVDARFFWDSPSWYWLMLASTAQSHQLESGIHWGLSTGARTMLQNAIAEQDFTRAALTIGWDPAHVQVKGISILGARLGRRP
jgi:hypothetical protein